MSIRHIAFKRIIEITKDVWNKYVERLQELISSNKITDKVALKIQEELDSLQKNLKGF